MMKASFGEEFQRVAEITECVRRWLRSCSCSVSASAHRRRGSVGGEGDLGRPLVNGTVKVPARGKVKFRHRVSGVTCFLAVLHPAGRPRRRGSASPGAVIRALDLMCSVTCPPLAPSI